MENICTLNLFSLLTIVKKQILAKPLKAKADFTAKNLNNYLIC